MKRIFSVIAAVLLMLMNTLAFAQGQGLEMHMLDVGKADCLLLCCDGSTMLVDTGLADNEETIRAYLSANGITSLTYIVATHPDKDHIGGMEWICNEYPIGTALICPLAADSKPYMRMMNAVLENDIPTVYPQFGSSFMLGSAVVEVLSPTEALLRTEDENECSIVLKVTYGETVFLLMGDAQFAAEDSLLAAGIDLSCDVLKVGHHGSKQATSESFLSAASPAFAAISCGEADGGKYPAKKTIKLLGKANIDIARTDEDGTVVYRTDGSSVTVETNK